MNCGAPAIVCGSPRTVRCVRTRRIALWNACCRTIAFKYGVEAYEFWGFAWLTYDPFRFGWHSYIHQTSEPGNSYWIRYPNGDGFLLYPGAAIGWQGIVSSVRFEQAREGAEDYGYLYLLRQLIAKADAAGRDVTAARQTLTEAGQLVDIPNDGGRYSTKILPDPHKVYEVRQTLAAAIESLQGQDRQAHMIDDRGK